MGGGGLVIALLYKEPVNPSLVDMGAGSNSISRGAQRADPDMAKHSNLSLLPSSNIKN